MEYHNLQEGMNAIKTPSGSCNMHIHIRNGKVAEIVLFNAKVTKKSTKTFKTTSTKRKYSHLVDLTIKTDW